MPSKVLLTGATGFIGQHCIGPLRARGYEVPTAFTGIGQISWSRGVRRGCSRR
jgi:NADPH:quinone reductase-like Zn-dependent oxidoreductase